MGEPGMMNQDMMAEGDMMMGQHDMMMGPQEGMMGLQEAMMPQEGAMLGQQESLGGQEGMVEEYGPDDGLQGNRCLFGGGNPLMTCLPVIAGAASGFLGAIPPPQDPLVNALLGGIMGGLGVYAG